MTFNEYQKEIDKTAQYPDKNNNYVYPVLGMVGEAGEVAEKIKKILRDKKGVISNDDKLELSKELGDVLWYIGRLATELGLSLDDVAQTNIEKISSRLFRDKISGSGDNR